MFAKFVADLRRDGFSVFHKVVDCADYGVPQHRKRLVLLASKHGPIEMIAPTVKAEFYETVRDAIEELPPLRAGASMPGRPFAPIFRVVAA